MYRRQRGHEEGWLLSYADLITNLLLFFVVLLTAANMSKGKMQQISKAISGESSPESLESIQQEIQAKIQEQNLQDVIQTKLQDEGLQLSLNSGVVFDSGRAALRMEFEPALESMLGTLTPYSSRYHFAVEGHTDSTPVAAGATYRSNWELSAARAIAVRERMERAGIARSRIRVEGYADTRPLAEEELKAIPEEQRNARQRRVVVRVF